MAELASLQIKVVRDGIEQAQKALNDLSKAADNAEKSSDGVGKGFETTSKKTKTFADDITSLAKKFTGLYIAKQIGDIGIACLKAAADMEQQKVAFTTMLGSAEKANQLLKDMQSFAASTPFEMTEIVDAGKRLVAFGFDASSVIGNLRMLGDVAAGLSQPVGDMVYLFGQIKTQGRAMTQDLMQFANRGVPIYDELAKVLGVSTAQVKDFASQGKIGFKEIEQVFKNMTSEGGKFGGLMDAQAKTLSGQWSNFGDNLERISTILGEKMMPAAKGVLDLINTLLESDTSEYQRKMEKIVKLQEKYMQLEAAGSREAGYYRGQIAELERSMLTENGRTQAILVSANATAKERLEIYKKIAGLTKEEAQAMGYVAGGEDIRSNLVASDLKAFGAKGVLTADQLAEIKKGKSGGGSGGKSTYNFASELKYANDTITGSMSEADQLLVKYNEQIDRLSVLQNAARKGSDAEMTAWNAKIAATQKFREEMEKLTGAADGFGIAMKDVGKQLANTAVNAAAQSFEKIGEALGKGEMSGKAMKKIMAEMMWQIISAIPMMMVSAGLQMIIMSGGALWAPGLALIGMGLAGQIGVGYVNGRIAAKNEEAANEAAAHGAVYGFARGGSFTNEIVNSPTRFMFSRGGTTGRGLMGEAGTEAVVPLRRMSNGNLGVESSGGGEVNVTIINGSGEPVNVKKEKGSNGGQDITVTVGAIVSKQLADGTYDSAFRARYGLNRRGV